METEAQRFRKKPVVVEAMRWDGSEKSQRAIVNWAGGAVDGWFDGEYYLEARTPHGVMRVHSGDWVVRDARDIEGFYPSRPDIFAATYEAVDA